MTYSDYKCPFCRRMKHLPGMSPVIERPCSCSTEPVQLQRVCWSKLDWRMNSQYLANLHDLPYHVVHAKRLQLGKPQGKKGRKVRTDYTRRITPDQIDDNLTNKENSLRFAAKGIRVSAEWIRRLRLEKHQKTAL